MERFGREIQAVIFDMDGTIFDTERIYYDIWTMAEEKFGFRGRDELFVRFAGSRVESVLDVLDDFFGDRALAEQVNRFRAVAVERLRKEYGVRFKPGARELLESLWEAGILTGLATSSLPDKMESQFRAVGLKPRFHAVVTGDMVERGKPEPDIFLKAAELLGVPTGRCMVLEDSPTGIRSAASSGAYAVMVPDIIQPDGDTGALAAEVLLSLEELIPFFRQGEGPMGKAASGFGTIA